MSKPTGTDLIALEHSIRVSRVIDDLANAYHQGYRDGLFSGRDIAFATVRAQPVPESDGHGSAYGSLQARARRLVEALFTESGAARLASTIPFGDAAEDRHE